MTSPRIIPKTIRRTVTAIPPDSAFQRILKKSFFVLYGHSRGSGNPVFSILSGLPLLRE
jgi:hypothetical protein